MSYKASVIISIYKNTTFLKVVLDSLKLQTEQNFEIIISEDGENKGVETFISLYAFQHAFQHLTQEDKGWRKTTALNNAVRHARADWLIFIDGDCVLHPRFVEMHLRKAKENLILSGRRVKLDKKTSDYLIDNAPQSILRMRTKVWQKLLVGKGQTKRIEEGIYIAPNSVFSFIHRKRPTNYILGSNMSFSKKAVFAINGFDEDFVTPTVGEDTDLFWRFKAAGYEIASVRSLAVQYHLCHEPSWTDNTENKKIMQSKTERNEYFCKNGLTKFNE